MVRILISQPRSTLMMPLPVLSKEALQMPFSTMAKRYPVASRPPVDMQVALDKTLVPSTLACRRMSVEPAI